MTAARTEAKKHVNLIRTLGNVLLGVAALALGVSATAGAATSLPKPVVKALERHKLPPASLSVAVLDTADGAPLLLHHPDTARHPASTIKLLTTFAALEILGPIHRWHTDFFAAGPVRNGRLEGDLVVVGSGDPLLVTEQLWRALAGLRARGLRDVAGRLVLDDSHFTLDGELDPGAFDGQPYRAYNAIPSALLVNFNALDMVVEPRGKKLRAWTEPEVAGLEIRNRAKIVKGRCKRRGLLWGVEDPLRVGSPLGDPLPVIALGGKLPRKCPRWAFSRTVLPPIRFADGVIRALWTQMGGSIEGGLARGKKPEGAVRWHRHRSPPLAHVIHGINKFSNNVMARNLLLTLGAERHGAPGTVEKGVRAIESWRAKQGIELPHLYIENGAGLARTTRITARGLGEILFAANRSRFWPEFAQTLPLASLDGTMRKRLKSQPGADRVRVKTGLVRGVRALAGYVRTESGRTLAVAALQQHPGVDTYGRGTAVQDALLTWLLER